jgi:hypothetical protein
VRRRRLRGMCVASFLPSISEKNRPPRVQKINLKACRCGLTGMCLCSWTVVLGREELDRPPLKWSDLRYVFDIKEDCNGKEAIQA